MARNAADFGISIFLLSQLAKILLLIPIFYLLVGSLIPFFLCWVGPANKMLTRSDESRNTCLIPDLKRNAFNISVDSRFFWHAVYQVKAFHSLPSVPRGFGLIANEY